MTVCGKQNIRAVEIRIVFTCSRTSKHRIDFSKHIFTCPEKNAMVIQSDIDDLLLLSVRIKGSRPSVPRRVKCQYVVNMSITCILKKCHQRDDKFPPLPPLKAPPLIKHSMGLFKLPGALQNTYN